MILDAVECSLKAPNRLIPVESLLGRTDGSRMPQVRPDLLNTEMAETACRSCPTSALSIAEMDGRGMLRFDHGECIGCGRCMAAGNAFVPAGQISCCGASRQELVQYFDPEQGTEHKA